MTDSLEIQPVAGPLDGRVRVPGSKSITNRALVCAALAKGRSVLRGALESEDTGVMLESLRRLGLTIESADADAELRVQGWGGPPQCNQAKLFVANSGTTMRFLTALTAAAHGQFRLDGVARMRERPIADLADALGQLGGRVECEGQGGCPPVRIDARGLAGGTTRIRGDISSQFLSGLLMAAPMAHKPVTIAVDGTLVSQPYVRMTLRVMEAFGVAAEASGDLDKIQIPAPQSYQGCDYQIEPDASAASYFFAAAAVTGGRVVVEGLSREALQGDVAFCDCLAQMGCQVDYGSDEIAVTGGPLQGIDVDMNAISDTVQTLAVVAAFASGTTRVRNVGHIRHKETDRIAAVAAELRKLGAEVAEHEDGLEISPKSLHGAAIDTYNDHRMAMSFAVAGLRTPGVVINDPGCTDKTYPDFFRDFAALAQR